MPDLGDGGGRPELGYDTDTGPAACHHPSRRATRCEGGFSVLFCVLLPTQYPAFLSQGTCELNACGREN